MAFVAGAWPMPMQGPQAHSSTRAPAVTSLASAPFLARALSTCLEPGDIVRLTSGATRLPSRMPATRMRSQKLEFVQLPMQTWSIFIPAISETGTTLSGECGCAAMGWRLERSSSISSSYSASGSASSRTHCPALPRAEKKSRVRSSLGKTVVVAPSSAPMLAIVARSGTERVLTPGPPYSIIFPTPPLTLRRRSSSSMTSLAETMRLSSPVR